MPEALLHAPFNSALETGVRALNIIAEAAPQPFDLERLVFFDYLVVHSGDVGGPTSLHPSTPMRNGELLVRRGIIERGMLLMVSRGLAGRNLTRDGISYVAADEAAPFLDCLTSKYARALRERAEWAVVAFGELDKDELKSYFDANFERWSREFQSTSQPELPL